MPTKRKRVSEGKGPSRRGHINPNPEKVRDPKFQQNGVLRSARHRSGRCTRCCATSPSRTRPWPTPPRSTACRGRPTSGQANSTSAAAGLGPCAARSVRGPHKLQGDVLTFVQQQLVSGEPVRARELLPDQQEFGPQAASEDDRAMRSPEKKLRDDQLKERFDRARVVTPYETLRKAALGGAAARCPRGHDALSPAGVVGMVVRRPPA